MNAKEIKQRLKTGLPVEKWTLAELIQEQEHEIVRLKLEWQYMYDRIEQLQDFAIWMTGCGYDFTKHEHFIKFRDNLLKGEQLFK